MAGCYKGCNEKAMRIGRFIVPIIAIIITGGVFVASAQNLGAGSGTISTLDQFTSTSSPFTAISPRTPAKNLYMPYSIATTSKVYATTFCINNTTPDCITAWPAGSSGSFSWTPQSWGNSTSTVLSFPGFISTASSTISYLGSGSVASNNGRLYNAATTTFNSPLNYSAGAVTLDTSGTWSGNAGTVTNGVYTTGSGTVFEVPVTAGDGLTRTVNDFDCDTASGTVFGCLSSTDWTTFNNKGSGTVTSIATTYPITGGTITTTGTLGIAFGTTTANTWADTQTFTKAITISEGTTATSSFAGNVKVTGNLQVDGAFFAPVTLVTSGNVNIAGNLGVTGAVDLDTFTSAILLTGAGGDVAEYAGASACSANNFVTTISAVGGTTCGTATISGVNLGGTLANLTATDSTLTFSGTYTGATARTIGLNLAQPNAWTGLATFTNASSTQLTAGTNTFYIDSAGRVQAKDTTNAWSGVVSPTRFPGLMTATTSTWTASTTGSAYSDFFPAPFAGTLKAAICLTDSSFVGVNIQINGSSVTPSYFVASTTGGYVQFTSGNTFTRGQKVLGDFGTTTTSSTKKVVCQLFVTETY